MKSRSSSTHKGSPAPKKRTPTPDDDAFLDLDALNDTESISQMDQKITDNTPGNAPDNTPSAGALLKAARETAGLSIDDVSRSLKLMPRQIQALEQQDFTTLPSRTFVRGFMRNYARLLNLDADAVLAALPPETPQSPSLAAVSIKLPSSSVPVLSSYDDKAIQPHTWKWLLAMAVLALVAAGFFFWPQIKALLPQLDAARTSSSETAPAHPDDTPPVQEGNVYTITPIITPLPETPVDPPPTAPPEN